MAETANITFTLRFDTIVFDQAISRLPDRLWRRYVELRTVAELNSRGTLAALHGPGTSLPGPHMIAYQLGIPLTALLIDLEGLQAEGLLIDEPDRFEIVVPSPEAGS